ncbi:hypothetical protein ANOM_007356 [Aspergillus nomiae NRRL 13137]|uniref:Uncharacterized protein n=1 Tax=Aspergillus nomiae NRRL (strain ATCC 15546 / NRRL 13137 / CBS 260.88 / M93) TaxID=1509407 RepID=A0A0L1IW91_ASPN3|nr:uncharacterized protein ANOM_007356 [Aspergillus nomiae NRRL 13137]KNG83836.1 hypothetical protein ANOM_007356 [Aspergillus nomiae NRRL 13137]
MSSSQPIILYDIASGPPVRCFASNPWKARYSLNFKRVSYRTEWVDLPEVASTRKALGVPPSRTFSNGSPFYTLPIIEDPSTGERVGDSFDIALYLEKAYPDAPQLFPRSSLGLHASFNAHVDALFSRFAILFFHGMPLNPETAEARRIILEGFKSALAELAKIYNYTEGPFLEGNTVSYADFIVGGWLQFAKASLPEWEDLRKWHEARWGRLHLALEKYAQVV